VESDFNIRELEKRILMSDAYQRSSTVNDTNRADQRHFARQYVRPLLAEVALDAVNKALGTAQDYGELIPAGSLAIEIGTNQVPGDAGRALQVFGRGQRESTCDCDRQTEADLRSFLFMVNDPMIAEKIRTGSIQNLLPLENSRLISQLYLRILGRRPDVAETEIGMDHFADATDRATAFNDLVWALLNSREFITNH
jgi:hypothetical protein